ncbi:MAG: DUF2062 domain-containing protein [Phormidesmis sp.]
MLDPLSKSNTASGSPLTEMKSPLRLRSEQLQPQQRSQQRSRRVFRRQSRRRRRSISQNSILKRLDALYWKRLLRYFYIRFLRMQSSPGAIARGAAAGAFAGAFPLIGLQTIIGIAIASCIQGNKVVAAASTWISNPFTYVPLFALNFHIGGWLLRLTPLTDLPASPANISAWLEMGKDVAAALMLGSLITGTVASVFGYYIGFAVALRVRKVREARRR